MRFFDNPHQSQHFLHVAGTKGKTSTSYYLYQMLQDCGKSAGLFVSPHVFSECERIQINGREISWEELAFYRSRISEVKEILSLPLGFFEEFLLIAFLFFQDHPVDYVVLEVGIGGLHDSTNVVIPEVSVVSRIQKDHEEILGRHLWQIVEQKLGILKRNRPFIIGKQSLFVGLYVHFRTLPRRRTRHFLLPFRVLRVTERESQVLLNGKMIFLEGPFYMRENFLLAASVLPLIGLSWSKEKFIHRVPGRMQAVEGYKRAFLDGAHNAVAAQVLVKTLKKQFPGQLWKIILCIRRDKDLKGIVQQLAKISKTFLLCPWDKEIDPQFDPSALEVILKQLGHSFLFLEKKNLNSHLRLDDNILVVGSFHHLAPVYKELRDR